jgi:hypothetical protein
MIDQDDLMSQPTVDNVLAAFKALHQSTKPKMNKRVKFCKLNQKSPMTRTIATTLGVDSATSSLANSAQK